MELKTYIERAEKAAGGQKALGERLGVNPSNLRNAKAAQQGLPVATCYQLAEMINEDPAHVIAASELITEKKPERRAYWIEKLAACIVLGVATNFVTPSPANALPYGKSLIKHCILCQITDTGTKPAACFYLTPAIPPADDFSRTFSRPEYSVFRRCSKRRQRNSGRRTEWR